MKRTGSRSSQRPKVWLSEDVLETHLVCEEVTEMFVSRNRSAKSGSSEVALVRSPASVAIDWKYFQKFRLTAPSSAVI